ncbi:ABC transporter ATP-binding protein [Shimia sediminis]|uniref:ABC transporter ATP-binding protein n=1 Tax=Shimia sediminis TaxID=2497945 RepID=UPI000F8E5A37|nr:ABC transporter ATP-binding protein [Shimia sediminis]
MSDQPMHVLAIRDLSYAWPRTTAPVLSIRDLTISAGESVFLRGPSGSGKSTLLSAIAGVIETQPGMVSVAGQDIGAMRSAARDQLRADHLGIVFQVFNLVPYLSVLDNVLLPCRFSPTRRARAGGGNAETAARDLLAGFGLGDQAMLRRRPGDLSVGQQQRVAAARALIGSPDLVLADEPTSALDSDLKAEFVDLFLSECKKSAAALLFVSHDRTLEPSFSRSLEFTALNTVPQAEGASC